MRSLPVKVNYSPHYVSAYGMPAIIAFRQNNARTGMTPDPSSSSEGCGPARLELPPICITQDCANHSARSGGGAYSMNIIMFGFEGCSTHLKVTPTSQSELYVCTMQLHVIYVL